MQRKRELTAKPVKLRKQYAVHRQCPSFTGA
jgi:hypothetical protein